MDTRPRIFLALRCLVSSNFFPFFSPDWGAYPALHLQRASAWCTLRYFVPGIEAARRAATPDCQATSIAKQPSNSSGQWRRAVSGPAPALGNYLFSSFFLFSFFFFSICLVPRAAAQLFPTGKGEGESLVGHIENPYAMFRWGGHQVQK